MSACPKKPNDAVQEKDNCPMFEEYIKCQDCPKYVNGYPKKKCLKICVNGKGYIAMSTIADNVSPPSDYINNMDSSKPWIVLEQCVYWAWLVNEATDGFLTEDEVEELVKKLIGDAFGDVLTNGKLDCAKLITHCGLATKAEVEAAQSTADNALSLADSKQGQLKNCAGADHAEGTNVPSCDEMKTAIGDAIGNIPEPPSLTKCGGGDIDGDLVQCDQLSDSDFTIDNNGDISVNTKKMCIETEEVQDPCATYDALYTVRGADGCARLISASQINTTIKRVASRDATSGQNPDMPDPGVELFPLDPTDTSSFYNEDQVEALGPTGNLDISILEKNGIGCFEIDFPCSGQYTFDVGALVNFNPALAGKSTFIISIDDEFGYTANGNLQTNGSFTSFDGGFEGIGTRTVSQGTHKICVYLVAAGSGTPPAQTPFNNTAGNYPTLTIRKS